jgi:protein O-mannosyl-transferase
MKKEKLITLIISLVLLLGLLLTYSNHFNNSFHFDDSHTISNNIYIRNLGNFTKFFTDINTFGSMPDNLGYRPVVTASTAVDYWIAGGYKPFYFHLSMFIIFVFQGLLMFILFLKIFSVSYKHEWNKYLVLFATAWYMFHPGNAETINYIIARSDSFSTFFVVMGLVCYMSSKFCRKYLLYLIPVALGVLSKETAAMFPLLLFFYILFFENKVSLTKMLGSQRKLLWKSIVTTLPALIFTLAVAVMVQVIVYKQTTNSGLAHTPVDSNHLKYILTQPYVLFTYFTNYFLPISLSSDPDLTVFSSLTDIRMYVGFLFIGFLLFIAFVCSKNEKYRPISFGIMWFFVAAIPTSVLAALTQVSNSHRLFYLYVGLTIAVVWTLYLFVLKIKPVFDSKRFNISILLIALVILLSNAFATHERNKVWKNDATLWYDIVQKGPENPRALMNYGLTLMERGYFFEAEFYYRRALSIWPTWPYLYINMGILKEATNQINEAEQYYLNAITYCGNTKPDGYYYYAKFLFAQKRSKEAIPYLLQSLAISPGYIQSRYLLMNIYAEQAYWEQLTALAKETLTLVAGDQTCINFIEMAKGKKSQLEMNEEEATKNPTAENYLNLSLQYYNAGDYYKCIDACNKALILRPNYSEAYNNICSAYNAMKMWDKGIEACEKALQCNPNNEYAKNNLKWARGEKEKGNN